MSGPTRRAVLLGGAALGTGAVLAGCGLAPESRALPAGTTTGSFRSAHAGRRVRWTLTAPQGHALDGLPVLISLHGRGGSERTALTRLHLDRVLDDVVGKGAPAFALATVDGGDHGYYHRRADGSDAGAMVRSELVPVLAEHGTDPDRVALHGWSMGGYGALLLAGLDRMPVRAVAVASPALFTSAARTAAGAFDSAADFDAHDVFGHPEWLRGVPVRLDCGRADPFYSATRDFAARLDPAAQSFRPGAHDADYWREVAPAQLRFVAERLG
ncbi:alpha/beta hydrolase [Marmoricola sp. RAF53]|uniref:alpha/beta hydrolase n=1 Tax=Marmoricola sp. RAF53 TaxID=3233059 RepID=UPI003F9D39E3